MIELFTHLTTLYLHKNQCNTIAKCYNAKEILGIKKSRLPEIVGDKRHGFVIMLLSTPHITTEKLLLFIVWGFCISENFSKYQNKQRCRFFVITYEKT